jgi:nitrite reductase (NO-forming)
MKREAIRFGATSMVPLMVALALVWVSPSQLQACDACSVNHLRDLIDGERAGSLQAREVMEAAKNQKGLPLGGLSNLQGTSERMLFSNSPIDNSQVDDIARSSNEDEGAPEPAPAPTPAPEPTGAAGSDAPFDLQKILSRDASLSIPPTSYVDQSVEADKRVEITLNEGKTYIGNGVVYEGFLIDGMIPGPTVRVRQGDVVEFVVHNTGSVPHGASLHAAYTQTSAYLGSIAPNSSKSLKFRASYPGVFLYHCAPGGHAIPMHVMAGQYGMMVVEPTEQKYKLEEELGHGPDLEIYLAQHEIYRSGSDAIEGIDPYVMFNGRLFRYVEEPIVARPGDYVRMYFINVGPNLLSTFHIVGIVWDYVYWQGHPEAVMPGGQTVTAGPSDSWVIEFRIPPEEGAYTMLSHAVGSTSRGAIGLIVASEDAPASKPPVLADGPSFTEQELADYERNATRTISLFGPGSLELERPVRYMNPEEEVFIDIRGNAFAPKVIEIAVGTTVTWTNEDAFTYLAGEFSGIHNVAALSGPTRFSSPMLGHGESWSYTFNELGEYELLCAPHPYMRAIVRVVEAPKVTVDAGSARGGGSGGGASIIFVVGALVVSLLALGVSGSMWMSSRPTEQNGTPKKS